MNSKDYCKINVKKRESLIDILSQLGDLYDTSISINQYISLRNILLKQKTKNGYHQINNLIGMATKEYNRRVSIIELSIKYDCNPSLLLKKILAQNGLSMQNIDKIFKLE